MLLQESCKDSKAQAQRVSALDFVLTVERLKGRGLKASTSERLSNLELTCQGAKQYQPKIIVVEFIVFLLR